MVPASQQIEALKRGKRDGHSRS